MIEHHTLPRFMYIDITSLHTLFSVRLFYSLPTISSLRSPQLLLPPTYASSYRYSPEPQSQHFVRISLSRRNVRIFVNLSRFVFIKMILLNWKSIFQSNDQFDLANVLY